MGERPGIVKAMRDPDLTPREQLLLADLAHYQGTNGWAFPGRATLAENRGVTERTIQRLIRSLREKGKIRVRYPHHQGRKMRTEYQVIDGKKGGANVSLFEPEGRHQCRQKGDTGVAPYNRRTGSLNMEGDSHKKPFIPPTVDQVREYAGSLGNPIFPAERFVEYYEGLDWHDKGSKQVKSWKGRVRTWHERENERRIARGEPPLDGYSQYGCRKASAEDVAMLQAEGIL